MKTEIPIELFMPDNKGGHLFVEVEINEEKGLMIIDTGASQSVFAQNNPVVKNNISTIDDETYSLMLQEIATEISEQNPAATTTDEDTIQDKITEPENDGIVSMAANGESIDFSFGVLCCISLGDITIKDMPVGCIDMTNISNLYEKSDKNNLVGLLGSDLLSRYNACIDYKNKMLTLYDE